MDNFDEEIQSMDDDVFYDELRRQVLQLTDDDDGIDDKIMQPRTNFGVGPGFYAGLGRLRYDWLGNTDKRDCETVPIWMMNLWRDRNWNWNQNQNGNGNGNGTGVFIPQIVHSRRRHRSRKKNLTRGSEAYKRVEKMN